MRIEGDPNGIGWEIAPPRPYWLQFDNNTDVICLLTGAIEAHTQYDDARPEVMRFEALTTAFHPAGGRVRVEAGRVSRGFLAFTFPVGFGDLTFGDDYVCSRPSSSIHNISSPGIANLVGYARALLACGDPRDGLLMESLAHLAHFETFRVLHGLEARARGSSLSKRELARLVSYIDANLAEPIRLRDLSRLLGLPVTTLRRRFQASVNMPLYRFVQERRLERAWTLLSQTGQSIAQVAVECGFSSQQHLTNAFGRRFGVTPGGIRGVAKRPPKREKRSTPGPVEDIMPIQGVSGSKPYGT